MGRAREMYPRLCAGLVVLVLLLNTSISAQVIISEFMAENKTVLADEDGDHPDWIELYNTTLTNVNLAGWALTDSAAHTSPWHFPATNIVAKGFLVVFASSKDRAVAGAPLHTDFSLKASGEYLALLRPDGSAATEFSPTFPAQLADVSYGYAQYVVTNTLLPIGAAGRVLIPADGSLGATWTAKGFSDSGWPAAITGIGYQTAITGFAVTNYISAVQLTNLAAAKAVIANPAQQLRVYTENVGFLNYQNAGTGGHYANDRTFPGLTMSVDQNDFVVEAVATITIPAAGNWTFGVNSDDGFGLTIGTFNMSYPNPRGSADTLQTFYFPAAGDYPLDLVFYERGGAAEVELFAAQGSLAAWDVTSFHLVGDTANGGLVVNAPAVPGAGSTSYRAVIQTDVQSPMYGLNSSAYIRLPFTVPDPSLVQSLMLQAKYDDGFVAYLNGQEVAARNAPAVRQWNSAAAAAHPNSQALVPEPINLTDHLNALEPGANVLAIQGLNLSASDNDFLIVPELVEYRATNTTLAYFAAPSPGGLNNAGFVAQVADTKFSTDRGFYDAPFSLSITTATAGATIIYTTNGSAPDLTNGTAWTAPLWITNTMVIRAAAFKSGYLPSDADTHTYIFVNDVIRQSPTGQAPPGWPTTWGANVVDYGMDPDVVNNPAYSPTIAAGLKSIPSYSIVTDLKNLFDPTTGIYANAAQDGADWERPASLELIYGDGTKGFQANTGLRIRGGFSRNTANPKHAFRFFFRQEYGVSKLEYPVFANQGGTETFDCFDLRTFENYSWSYLGDYRFIALRDMFSRETQLLMGWPGERGDFFHLYINGQYWGLYNTCERAEASYGEAYFGGSKEDYDVIKVDSGAGYTIFATDGTMDAWLRLWQAATNGFAADADYFRIQGLNVDGTANAAYENLLEVDELIDYMLIVFFTGNIDVPVVVGGTRPNNMYALRNRTGQYGGFRFVLHDNEHTLLHESSSASGELYRDRTGPFAAGDPVQQGASAFSYSNPQYVFTRLMDNAEFRLRVADHVQKHFFNGGLLSTESCRARFQVRSNEIYAAVADESARWGDAKRATPLTRDVEWATEMGRVYDDYFAQRPSIVLTQLQAKALYPTNVAAPTLNQYGGNIPAGFTLVMAAPAGTIWYTRDGSDPRLRGGAVSPAAYAYSSAFVLNQSLHLKARTLVGTEWSGLIDVTFYVIQNFKSLLLTEIMYHPPDSTTLGGDEFEFIELKSVATTNLELSGLHFTDGVDFTFPVGKFIAPGQFVVLVANPAAFTNRYPGVPIAGVYARKLSNSGERLTLAHVNGTNIFSVDYATRAPWPASPDGTGFSLVPVNPNYSPDPANPANWRASSEIGGSPGRDDPSLELAPILITEALTHTDLPQLDSVELYNPTATNVSIGNWYLTDDRMTPQKFRIPAGTTIGGYGYKLFTETDWNNGTSNSFRLDSHGEEIYVYSADTNGNLTGYSDGFPFGAAQNGVTFGRYIISTGEAQYPAQRVNTLGSANAGPRVGPVVINEIQYHPAPGSDEFVELKSITNGPVKLYDPLYPTNTWRLHGVGYDFPTNTTLAANALALLVGIDPAAFRVKYSVDPSVPIFGPWSGSLQGGSETLSLQYPDHPDLDTNTGSLYVPYIDVDVVHYADKSPWPTNADGAGASLERLDATSYGNDPINWRASPGSPSPGLDNYGNRFPAVYAGPDLFLNQTSVPFAVPLSGAASDDGRPVPPGTLTVNWSQVAGPPGVWFSNPSQTNTTAWLPGIGSYVLRLSASDGALQVSDDVVITAQHPLGTTPVTLVARGSVWKFLDNGSNQGTTWTSRTFSDGAWPSGPAPLGYGDANGQWPATTNSYGPDPNNKFITTYYRRSFVLSNVALLTNLWVSIQRDDGVVAYLNGTPIFTNNMPTNTAITYTTYASGAVGGTDETNFYSQRVSSPLLVNGTNVLAAEIHQAASNSTDIIFDLQLTADTYPANQRPTADAGPDQTLTLPNAANLNGAVTDDGLPLAPGVLTATWGKISGPGTVAFAPANLAHTSASFTTNGTYVLRLTANDGEFAVTDDVVITVNAQPVLPRIDSCSLLTNPLRFHLRFTATAGVAYTIQSRVALDSGSWVTLASIPAQSFTIPIDLYDPITTSSSTRFYRLSSP